MLRRNPIAIFLCRFVVVYAILAGPWLEFDKACGDYFCAICQVVFAADDGPRHLSFETSGESSSRRNGMRVVIVNKALLNRDGSGPVRNVDVHFGRQPAALLVALIVATPISWPRRGWALWWGILSLHGLIILFLSFCVWNESAEVLLTTMDPFRKSVAKICRGGLTDQLSLAIPVLIWVLVTFRREDRLGGLGRFVVG